MCEKIYLLNLIPDDVTKFLVSVVDEVCSLKVL